MVDLRLVLPAAVAWIAGGIAVGFPEQAGVLAAVAWAVAAGGIAIVISLAARRPPLAGGRLSPIDSEGPARFVGGASHAKRAKTHESSTGVPELAHDGPRASLDPPHGRAEPAGRGIRWAATAALCLIAIAVVSTSIAARTDARRPAELVEAASASRYLTADAVVDQTVTPATTSYSATLVRVTIGRSRLTAAVPVRVFVEGARGGSDVGSGGGMGIGTRVQLAGTLSPTDAGDDTAFLLFTRAPPTVVATPSTPLQWADGLRTSFRSIVAGLPGDGAALLPGLAIGDTTGVGPDLDQAMKDSSLSHLTAVSGANCAVIIALVMVGGGVVGLSRPGRIIASIAVLTGFIVLVTPEPSVLRAGVMVTIVLIATARGRPVHGMPVVALAVLILLVLDPWLSRQYGFVLSVLATTGLLVLSGPLTTALGRWMPRPVAAALSIPLAAQLACQPVLVLLAPTVPLGGVVANILAEPAAPIATVVGLAACLLAPLAPLLAVPLAWIAWLPASWIAAVAVFFSGIPGAQLPVPEGPLGVAALAVATAVLLVALLGGGRVRTVAIAVVVVAVVAGTGATIGTAVRTAVTRPGDWQYADCDIGQGDAFIVRSAGRIAVIDTGPDPEPMSHCLSELGIERVDLLVLSHFDTDHVGGTSALFGMVDVAFVGPSDGPAADRLVSDLAASGARVTQVARGRQGTLGVLDWRVLWPPDPLAGVEPGNPASVTIEFTGSAACGGGCLSAMFLGDLGEDAQNLMLARNRLTPVDVVEVAHHGSADQSARTYEALSATVGLIGVGADNTYGHPNARALDILRATGTEVGRTDRDGLILVAPGTDGGVRMWTERGG